MKKRLGSIPPDYKDGFRERQAARMRLPVWVRYLMPIMIMSSILALTAGSIMLLWSLHRALHTEISLRTLSDIAGILIFLPSFIGAMAPGMMLLNLLLHHIPPMRRIFENNSRKAPGVAYREAMAQLRKVAIFLVPPSLILALIGAIEPWAL